MLPTSVIVYELIEWNINTSFEIRKKSEIKEVKELFSNYGLYGLWPMAIRKRTYNNRNTLPKMISRKFCENFRTVTYDVENVKVGRKIM